MPAALALLDQLGPAIQRADRARQVEIIADLIELRAPMGEQWQQLTHLAGRNGEYGLARQAIDLMAEASGGGHLGQYWKVALLFDLGFSHEAEALLLELPEDVPNPLSNAYSRGVAALNFGRTEEARRCFEQVTRTNPQMGSAWLAFAQASDFAREPELAEPLLAVERAMQAAAPAERGSYYYALGKAHAERGEHAQAFSAFAHGAELMKSAVRYDRRQDQASAAAAVEGYSSERVGSVAARQREETGRTIFVTGLPRSGTTLVEQILASHSAVTDGTELAWLPLLAQEVGGPSFPALARYTEANGSGAAAALWDHWIDGRFPAARRIVNKAVDTSRFLGVAAALLPEAPLIWVTSDPLDRAWSCFRTSFLGSAIPWSYDLGDIAFHFRLEDRLLAQWQEILGDRLLMVPYESLVDDPSGWTGRILTHCGLDPEPQVFAPHENRRPVATSSLTQIRRPINRNGIGAAEPYREFLRPFMDAYFG